MPAGIAELRLALDAAAAPCVAARHRVRATPRASWPARVPASAGREPTRHRRCLPLVPSPRQGLARPAGARRQVVRDVNRDRRPEAGRAGARAPELASAAAPSGHGRRLRGGDHAQGTAGSIRTAAPLGYPLNLRDRNVPGRAMPTVLSNAESGGMVMKEPSSGMSRRSFLDSSRKAAVTTLAGGALLVFGLSRSLPGFGISRLEDHRGLGPSRCSSRVGRRIHPSDVIRSAGCYAQG